ncbi:hypothetical protein [Pedosphaera parvula]|uniref:Uncharacterized protein n=1 Tax=Pedosphaera parvula (strain Ellin514) TaxID=320771 RepID=B9XLV0_PEDPL|nr:hypothetical protein [Pedosphaera parvula]EEF59207.1 conserved hypothetical protein [Pedosphaera parvula Ellin514]
MKFLLAIIGFGILFVLCWPLAVLLLVLLPIVWLIALPFRIFFILVEAILTLLRAILFLPARMLGWKRV